MSARIAKLWPDEVQYLTALVRKDLRRRRPGEDDNRDNLAKYALIGLGVPDDEVDRLVTTPRLQVLP